MPNILSRLKSHSQERPTAAFCTFRAGPHVELITFSDLYVRARAYARALRAAGVVEGDVVIVILQHTPHLFYSYLGAMLAGAIPSFMPFPSPKQRPELYWADLDALFRRIEPKLVVTYERNAADARAAVPGLSVEMLVASDELLARDDPDAELPGLTAGPEAVACLQHSSGTTSLKKGVMLTHGAILAEVAAYSQAIALGKSDVIASWLPLYHDMGFVACFLTSVIEGVHHVALDAFEWTVRPHILFDAIAAHRATLCWLPNFAFAHLVNTVRADAVYDLSSMRAFVNCSEPCKPHTFEHFLERFAAYGVRPEALTVCYAMAENVFGVTQTPLGRPVRALTLDGMGMLSCGPPIAGVRVTVRDEARREVSPGTVGEIHIESAFLFDGYYRLPEKTAERLREGRYATGDMGLVVDGELYVTGRIDDMMIVNGRNYYAHEIEALAGRSADILPGRAVAIAVEDPLTDATVVVLLAECAPEVDPKRLAAEVRRIVQGSLGLNLHRIVPLSAGRLVKTTSGKLSRAKNADLYRAGKL